MPIELFSICIQSGAWIKSKTRIIRIARRIKRFDTALRLVERGPSESIFPYEKRERGRKVLKKKGESSVGA